MENFMWLLFFSPVSGLLLLNSTEEQCSADSTALTKLVLLRHIFKGCQLGSSCILLFFACGDLATSRWVLVVNF